MNLMGILPGIANQITTGYLNKMGRKGRPRSVPDAIRGTSASGDDNERRRMLMDSEMQVREHGIPWNIERYVYDAYVTLIMDLARNDEVVVTIPSGCTITFPQRRSGKPDRIPSVRLSKATRRAFRRSMLSEAVAFDDEQQGESS